MKSKRVRPKAGTSAVVHGHLFKMVTVVQRLASMAPQYITVIMGVSMLVRIVALGKMVSGNAETTLYNLRKNKKKMCPPEGW